MSVSWGSGQHRLREGGDIRVGSTWREGLQSHYDVSKREAGHIINDDGRASKGMFWLKRPVWNKLWTEFKRCFPNCSTRCPACYLHKGV